MAENVFIFLSTLAESFSQKKEAGNYKDGKYDARGILNCLAKAQQSNADNTAIKHTDTNTPSHDVLGWNEPIDYSALYSCIGMNSNIYITKCYYDNLTNFDGKGNREDHVLISLSLGLVL